MAHAIKRDVAQEIADRILEDLERGVLPWQPPFAGAKPLGLPRNAVTQKTYNGANVLILWGAALKHGFTSPYWLTFKQALDAGANVKKGMKGTHVVFYKTLTREETGANGETEEKRIPMMRTFCVFNLDQIEGLDHLRAQPEPTLVGDQTRNPRADLLAAETGAKILFDVTGEAYYNRRTDEIHTPPLEAMRDARAYYATLFHELAHWTGAESRLARVKGSRFGDPAYAFEELVAETTAAFVCAELGLGYDTQHANYIGHWIKAVKDDKKAFFHAAALAQKAADFIFKRSRDEQAPQEGAA